MRRQRNFSLTDELILTIWELPAPEPVLLQLLRELEGDSDILFWGDGTLSVPEPRNNKVYLFKIDLREGVVELLGVKDFQ